MEKPDFEDRRIGFSESTCLVRSDFDARRSGFSESICLERSQFFGKRVVFQKPSVWKEPILKAGGVISLCQFVCKDPIL